MNRNRVSPCFIAMTWLFAGVSLALAESTERIVDVQVGIDGQFKLGVWTPIRASIETAERSLKGRLKIVVPDAVGAMASFETKTVELAAGKRHELWSYAKLGRDSVPVVVEFEDDARALLRRTVASGEATDRTRFVVSLGDDLDIDQALPRGTLHRCLRDPDQLPDHQLGYDGVDIVVIPASASEYLSRLTANQQNALVGWARSGGNVILIASTDSEEWIAGVHPYSDLVPGTIQEVALQRQTTGIEQFAKATTPVGSGTSAARFGAPIVVISDVSGRVEVVEGFGVGRPSVVRGSIGFGQSLFVAFDLTSAPFDRWPDRPRLMGRVLDLVLSEGREEDRYQEIQNKTAASLGFDDLSGQLQHALDRFPNVSIIPFSMTATLIALYILLIGPVDYWLLKKWGRPTWTWCTFSLFVVAFVIASVAICGAWKGSELSVRQATVVDVDTSSGATRGTSWIHLFTPASTRQTLDLHVPTYLSSALDEPANVHRALCWQGRPGAGFGGMEEQLAASAFSRPYQVSLNLNGGNQSHVFLEGFSIATRSSRGLLGRWLGQANMVATSQLRESAESQLDGTVTNPCGNDLEDAYLIYGRWAYQLGALPAHGSAALDDHSAILLRTLLNQRRIVDGRATIRRWDAGDVDVNRILMMMMFYASGSARSYTQLKHDHQSFIDISRHLSVGQAVLLGRSQLSACEITVDGIRLPADQQVSSTFFRFLIPVQPRE